MPKRRPRRRRQQQPQDNNATQQRKKRDSNSRTKLMSALIYKSLFVFHVAHTPAWNIHGTNSISTL